MASPFLTNCSVERSQTGEVFFLRQHLRLERLQARGQGHTALQDFAGADQPEGRVLGQALGIIDILVPVKRL
jgi:hypothetical protein